ncbi:MAG: hypothetical protein IPK13_24445 [Deltaproteobacteria bacterium]|nr:hypothetical protein [Deltaproteobacteria bacterium]
MNVSDIVHRFSPETLRPLPPKTTRQRRAQGRNLGGFSPQAASEVKHDAHATRGPFVHHDRPSVIPNMRFVLGHILVLVRLVVRIVMAIIEIDLGAIGGPAVRRAARDLDTESRAIGFLTTTTFILALANLLDDVRIEHGHS